MPSVKQKGEREAGRRSAPISGEELSGDAPAEKPYPRKLYGPGEVVRASGISRQVLHNYTVLGLLQPAEVTPTNRRYYDERVFARIRLIRRMLVSGYRLRDLRETFKWDG